MCIRRQVLVPLVLQHLTRARNRWQREKEEVELNSIRLAYIRPIPFVLYL